MPPSSPNSSYRYIWALSWPVMLSNISLPLVGAVDVAMMGHLADPAFVGGVALGGLIFNFIYLGFSFLRMGTTGFTARARGAEQSDEVNHIFARAMFIAIASGICLIIGFPFILVIAQSFIETSDAAQLHMTSYLSVRIWGLPASLCNAVLLGWLFGLQAMRLCMLQLFIINGINIALNFLFVIGLGMEIKGVALASICAEWAGLVIILYIVSRQLSRLKITLEPLKKQLFWARDRWLAMLAIARDLSLRTLLLWGVEALLITQAAQRGDVELAAIQILLVMFGLIAFALDGFAHATEALVGQAIGSGAIIQLKQIIKRANYLAGISAVFISIALYGLQGIILAAMTSQADLLELVSSLWGWCIIMPVAAFLAFQMDGVHVGAGTSQHMRNGMLFAVMLFMALLWTFKDLGLDGLMLAFIVYLAVRGIYLMFFLPSIFSLCQPSAPPPAKHLNTDT